MNHEGVDDNHTSVLLCVTMFLYHMHSKIIPEVLLQEKQGFEETQSNLPSISWSVRRFGFDLVTNG